VPGQGNNAYVFPGIGLGAIASGARRITERMFLVAAQALAHEVTPADLALGRIYPPLSNIRDVSSAIATSVAREAYRCGVATLPEPIDLRDAIRQQMYEPYYRGYVD
jgi:malate dehydrogenase (oxaloacetate-decarboxylating)(NADP+)